MPPPLRTPPAEPQPTDPDHKEHHIEPDAVGRHPCLRIRVLLRATLVGAAPVRQAQLKNTPGVFFGVLVESPRTARERRTMGHPRIFLSAGETSGDLHGANLVRALRRLCSAAP